MKSVKNSKTALWIASVNGFFQLVSINNNEFFKDDAGSVEFIIANKNQFLIQQIDIPNVDNKNSDKILIPINQFGSSGFGAFELHSKARIALMDFHPKHADFFKKLCHSMDGYSNHLICGENIHTNVLSNVNKMNSILY